MNNNSKNGGPYTKKEQENLRKKVYELHFEKGFPAVSIANELGINRNTVGEYIKYWQYDIASQFKDNDVGGGLLKQIEFQEVQRKRLVEMLEKADENKKLRIEKMLFEISCKLAGLFSKIAEKKINIRQEPKYGVSEKEASEILAKVVKSINLEDPKNAPPEDILKQIAFVTGRDTVYSAEVFEVLKRMGLVLFQEDLLFDYDVMAFIESKGILTLEEIDRILKETRVKYKLDEAPQWAKDLMKQRE